MAQQIPKEVDPTGFETKLEACNAPLKEMIAYLRNTATYSGPGVIQRRYRHPPPNSGWGVTYYRNQLPFCDLHPKERKNHVWAFLHGVDPNEVKRDGFQPSKQADWFQIRTMPEAVRFVRWILSGHDDQH